MADNLGCIFDRETLRGCYSWTDRVESGSGSERDIRVGVEWEWE